MATNTWSSTGSTDGNLGSNWSLGVLSATDDLTFNATSVINCTFTGAISCNTIVATTGYTGILSSGGNNIGFYFGDLLVVHTGIRAYVFQCSYNGSDWLDNPSTLISQLQTALGNITNLNSYLQLKVANVRNSTKKEIEIEIVSIQYLTKTRLTAAENDSLISDLQTALDTITSLTYDHVNIVNDIFRENPTFNWAQSMQKVT